MPITQLLRSMFSSYFLMVAIAGSVGMVAVGLTGRVFVAMGIGLIAALRSGRAAGF